MKAPVKILVISLLFILLGGCSKTVMEINGEKVSKKVYDWEKNKRIKQHKGKHVTISDDILKKSSITAIINRVLIVQEALTLELMPTQKEFFERWDAFVERFQDRTAFETFMKENNMSVLDMKRLIRESLMMEKFREHLYGQIEITDKEVKRFYQEQNWKAIGPVKLKAGFIHTSSREKVDTIVSEMKRTTFDTVFYDLQRKRKKGIVAEGPVWIRPRNADKDFLKATDGIISGRYKGPFKIRDEWYVIKVYARKAEMPGFEEVKEDLRKSMHDTRAQKDFTEFLKKKAASSDITIYKDRL